MTYSEIVNYHHLTTIFYIIIILLHYSSITCVAIDPLSSATYVNINISSYVISFHFISRCIFPHNDTWDETY